MFCLYKWQITNLKYICLTFSRKKYPNENFPKFPLINMTVLCTGIYCQEQDYLGLSAV